MRDITALIKAVDYDPETGIFLWVSPLNGKNKAGDPAGRLKAERSYLIIHHMDIAVANHIVAHTIMTGEYPTQHIEHINGDPLDNRWSNLGVRAKTTPKIKPVSIKEHRKPRLNPFLSTPFGSTPTDYC